jgi:hypothetical protein
MFIGDNTLTLQMPMVLDGKYVERGPKPTDKQLKRFDIGKWVDSPVAKAETKAESKATGKPKAKAKPETCTVNPEPTLEDRLRAALLKQLRMAA